MNQVPEIVERPVRRTATMSIGCTIGLKIIGSNLLEVFEDFSSLLESLQKVLKDFWKSGGDGEFRKRPLPRPAGEGRDFLNF